MFNINTEQIKAIQEIGNINELSDSAIRDFESRVNDAYKLFWYGAVSPVIKAQMLGTEAMKIFTASATGQEVIKTLKALKGEVYEVKGIPEGFELTWNEDGSCIIVDNRVQEQE